MGEGAEEEIFEISAVARLTGLSTHVLRVWERRYGVVAPDRSQSKRRLYGRDDIHRLSLLKTLVDHGHTISSIATLELTALEERLAGVLEARVEQAPEGADLSECRIGMVAVQARKAVRDATDTAEELSLAAEFSSISQLVDNVKPGVLDLLVIEVGSLFPDTIIEIQKALDATAARRAIVVFQFASDEVVEPGNIERITALRAPVRAAEILLACASDIQFSRGVKAKKGTKIRKPDGQPIPERMFSPEQLVTISKRASAVKCECPQHLAQLLSSLVAFEDYSEECENRNEDDAELHAYLHRSTAQCRLQLEQALEHVMEVEGITL